MDFQDNAIRTLNGFAGNLGSLQPIPAVVSPQAFISASSTDVPKQTILPHRNSVHRPSTRRNQHSHASASCTLCRRRKVKCDRNVPCGSCSRAGVECVPSAPSQGPRGRQGGRKRRTDGELLERIAKLEGLVKNVEGHSDEHGMTPQRISSIPANSAKGPPPRFVASESFDRTKDCANGPTNPRSQNAGPRLDRYLGSSFWSTLSDEINGLKDVLDGSSDEGEEGEDGQTPESTHSSTGRPPIQQEHSSDSVFVICPMTPTERPGHPTPHQLFTFCEVYLTNVDPVFKVLHGPSLRKHLQEGATELDCSPGPGGLEALRFAICFSAAVSMTDGECQHRIGEDKAVLMSKYRAGTELALAKADFINSDEMSTLQALTIYLASVRVYDTRRLMWTLTSLAVRIAQAMNLHHESSLHSLRPFEREMRRRLWWQISLLDSHAAEDRATNPVVYADSFTTRLPLRVNDEDLHVDSSAEVEEREGYTDMTFCLVCHEIMDTSRQLNYVPARELGQPSNNAQEKWSQRVDAVITAQQRIEKRHLRHLNIARPFHWVTRIVADIITANMWLIVYRPLQKRPTTGTAPNPGDPGVLGLSVEVLERTHRMTTDPAASPYRWLAQTYVQWHALAVTVAELCSQTEGPAVERAWAIIMPVFQDASEHVADSNLGMLWRPIRKLMNRAQELRQKYLESRSAKNSPSTNVDIPNGLEQCNHRMGADNGRLDINDDLQEVMEGITSNVDGLQSGLSVQSSAPFDWTPWLAAASTSVEPMIHSQFSDDTNQVAWNNWENFVSGFQGEEDMVFPGTNAERADSSTLWP